MGAVVGVVLSCLPALAQEFAIDEALRADRDAIRSVQGQLNDLGFDAGRPDGAFGPGSTRAMTGFAARFAPDLATGLTEDMVARLELVHTGRFGSPFDDNGAALVTLSGFLEARDVYRSDVRDETPACADCNVTSFLLAAGDMNGDGRDEIVISHHASDANFRVIDRPTRLTIASPAQTRFEPFAGIAIDDLPLRVHGREGVIADFNGDGLGDLFVAAHGYDVRPFPGEQNVLILSGPDGHTDVSASHLPQIDDMAHGVAAGDIDGDGDIDLVVITNEGSARILPHVLRNDGAGRFTYEEFGAILDDTSLIDLYSNGPHRAEYSTARLADVNGDGALDLLLLARGEQPRGGRRLTGTTMSVLLWNDGSGQFSVDRMVELPTDRWGDATFTNDAEVIDLDGDGRMDLILTQSTRTAAEGWRGHYIQVLMQEADGVFTDRTAERIWPQGYALPLGETAFADKSTLIDIDGDGDLDLVTRSLGPALVSRDLSGAIVQVGINDGTGVFAPADPRWLSGYRDYYLRSPIAAQIGPEGESGLVSYRLYGSYNGSRDQTWGVELSTHRLR